MLNKYKCEKCGKWSLGREVTINHGVRWYCDKCYTKLFSAKTTTLKGYIAETNDYIIEAKDEN